MIRKGDTVTILPTWQDEGDAQLTWVARNDEEKGRVDISALELKHLPLWPMQTVRIGMLMLSLAMAAPSEAHMSIKRYIIIDNNTGFIFADTAELDGPARDETPLEAVKRLDDDLGQLEYNPTVAQYAEHGPRFRVALNEDAYHVWRCAISFPLVVDGQDQRIIGSVEKDCEHVAVITVRRSYTD